MTFMRWHKTPFSQVCDAGKTSREALSDHSIDMMEVKAISLSLPPPRPLTPPPPSVFSLTLAAVARHWRTAQSPCPSDTRMGSSQTATAATGSKWQSRNTWRPSLGKGIDRELEPKDVGSHICSTIPKPEKKNKIKKRNKT